MRFSPPTPYTAPSPRSLRTRAVVLSPCLHARRIQPLCLKQTAPLFLGKTKFKMGLGSQNSKSAWCLVPMKNPSICSYY